MDDFHRLLDKQPRVGNLLPEGFRRRGASLVQDRQMDIDAHQGLGDDIVQLAADPLPLLLLGVQDPVGQVAQLLLLQTRLPQETALFLAIRTQVLLDLLSADDFLFQFHVPETTCPPPACGW